MGLLWNCCVICYGHHTPKYGPRRHFGRRTQFCYPIYSQVTTVRLITYLLTYFRQTRVEARAGLIKGKGKSKGKAKAKGMCKGRGKGGGGMQGQGQGGKGRAKGKSKGRDRGKGKGKRRRDKGQGQGQEQRQGQGQGRSAGMMRGLASAEEEESPTGQRGGFFSWCLWVSTSWKARKTSCRLACSACGQECRSWASTICT